MLLLLLCGCALTLFSPSCIPSCSDATGAVNGRPHRGAIVVWAQASHDVVHGGAPGVPPPLPRTCADIQASWPHRVSGPAAVWPLGDDAPPSYVECDFERPGEAWTLVFASSDATSVDSPRFTPQAHALVASSRETRFAVSLLATPLSRAGGSDNTSWVAMPTPDALRGAHPVEHEAVDLPNWPVRTAADGAVAQPTMWPGSAQVRFGSSGFGQLGSGGMDGSASTALACGSEWAAADSEVLGYGRVCVQDVVWSNFAAPSTAPAAAFGTQCSPSGSDSDSDNTTACEGAAVFTMAVRHVTTRSREVPAATSCARLQQATPASLTSGWYTIYPNGDIGTPVATYCDFDSAEGGWTVVFTAPQQGSVYVPDEASLDGGRVLGAQPLQYAPGLASLVNDGRNEVLLAYRYPNGTEAVDVAWVRFAIPSSWRTRHPGAAQGSSEAVTATVEGEAASVEATVLAGRSGFVGAGGGATGCGGGGGTWDVSQQRGRLCVASDDVTAATPFWSDFVAAASGSPSRCGTSDSPSDGGAASPECSALGLAFTIAVRRVSSTSSDASAVAARGRSGDMPPGAAASCAEVDGESGTYPLFPSVAQHMWHRRGAAPKHADTVYTSCGHVLQAWPTAPNGVYNILPPGPAASVRQVYCDMASGGFMHCGTTTAGSNATVGPLPLGFFPAGSATDRSSPGFSLDCSWALSPGASVTMSSSAFEAVTASEQEVATLISDRHTFAAQNASDNVIHENSWR